MASDQQPPQTIDIYYTPTPTLKRFHASTAFVRGVMGPVGSSKSTACVMDLFDWAMRQKPHNGVRKTRMAIIRNTMQELIQTSMKTWKDWVSTDLCPLTLAVPMSGDTKRSTLPGCDPRRGVLLPDGTYLDMEVWFLALDREEDISKLKSLELTFAWLNEACEIEKAVLDMAELRVGRYPSPKDGGPSKWGIIMDTNPPDVDSWYYNLAEVIRPKNYEFFRQPPAIVALPRKTKDAPLEYVGNTGLNGYPPAENIDNLPGGFDYYLRTVHSKTQNFISIYYMAQYGTSDAGKPVFTEYKDDIHCAKEPLIPYRALPLILGWDYGRTPAVAFCQLSPRGQLRVIDELTSEGMGITMFAKEIVKPHLSNHYHGMEIRSVGDPAGNSPGQNDERTCMQILAELGIPTEPATSNDFTTRREAVEYFLIGNADGDSAFKLSPKCVKLRQAFQGRYRYRQMRVGTGIQYANDAEKNAWSHCIARGAMIAMADGRGVPIEDVRAGMMVATPDGPRAVLKAWLTRRSAPVFHIVASNGATLRATGNHLVLVSWEWKRVDSITPGDELLFNGESDGAVGVVGVHRCRERSDVFDLVVDGAHCFFANGILVHNCMDALQYACMIARGDTSGWGSRGGENTSTTGMRALPVEMGDMSAYE